MRLFGNVYKINASIVLFVLFVFTRTFICEGAFFSEDGAKPVVKTKANEGTKSLGQLQDFAKLLLEGKRLYLEEMKSEQALEKFEQAEAAAQTRSQKADACFYLSLVHYSLWGTDSSEDLFQSMNRLLLINETIRKIIQYDYYKELDKSICPKRYLELYSDIKKEYGTLRILTSPPGADVFLGNSRDSEGKTPLTLGHKGGIARVKVKLGKKEKIGILNVISEQETESPLYSLKRRSGILCWIGGAVLAGGAAAVLLTIKEASEPAGSIHVYTVPTGAEVFLDGVNTGRVTDCLLSDISPGPHTIDLIKEGYVDESRDVIVEDAQITTINVTLTKHTLSVEQPTGSTSWIRGEEAEIIWDTGTETHANTYGFLSLPCQHSASISVGRKRKSLQDWKGHHDFPVDPLTAFKVRTKQADGIDSQMALKNIVRNRKTPSVFLSVSHLRGNEAGLDGEIFVKTNTVGRMRGLNRAFTGPPNQGGFHSLNDVGLETLSNVKIELYRGSSFDMTVASSASNTGSYTWMVPSSIEEAMDYSIRISCVEESSIFDESEQFVITYGYSVLKKWGSQGNAEGQFDGPEGIDVEDFVYVADLKNHRIQKFALDGTFIKAWGSYGAGDGQFKEPIDVAASQSGDIFIVEREGNRVMQYTTEGDFVRIFNQELDFPHAVDVDTNGFVYVLYNHDNSYVAKFTPHGALLLQWGQFGTGDGDFFGASKIELSPENEVYVVDQGNHRVQVFSSDGVFLRKFGSRGEEAGNFENPCGICADKSGYVYVTDGFRAQKFTSEGRFMAVIGDREFSSPWDIGVDDNGDLYIIDRQTCDVAVYTPDKQ